MSKFEEDLKQEMIEAVESLLPRAKDRAIQVAEYALERARLVKDSVGQVGWEEMLVRERAHVLARVGIATVDSADDADAVFNRVFDAIFRLAIKFLSAAAAA